MQAYMTLALRLMEQADTHASPFVHAYLVTPRCIYLSAQEENGPLEAAWGIAAMARSLEMLKGAELSPELQEQWHSVSTSFVSWYRAVVHLEMDFYVAVITKRAVDKGIATVHGNWHSSIAEAWMAVGVLTDDQALYDKVGFQGIN